MAYEHGIKILEKATSVPRPTENPTGVPVIFGTAPVGQKATPADVTNVPVLVNTYAEAVEAFGYSNNYAAYTLCEAMDAFFKAFGVGPVVMVNVLDASTGVSASGTADVADGQAVFQMDIVASTLALKKGNTDLTAETDYTYEYDEDGNLVVTFISNAVSDGDTITLGSGVKKINSGTAKCGVTAATVIGSYNSSTGATTGIECLRKVYAATGRFPSLILAPGYSDATVGAALAAKCESISGLFKCECVYDLDPSTAPTVAAIGTAKASFASEHMIIVFPKVKYNGVAMDYSALYAAMLCYKDATEDDGAPTLRQSNNVLPITAAINAAGNEVYIDHDLANEINGLGIVTAYNRGGTFVSWGNNTAAYPTSNDTKDRWIGIRRFFSWWGNSFIVNYMDRVDDPANGKLIEAIVDSENIRGNSFVSSGKCAGMQMEYLAEDNTAEELMNGRVTFRMSFAPYTPAENIIEILEFDPEMLEAAFTGGEE